MNDRIYYENAFVLFMDEALNKLTPEEFSRFIETLYETISYYKEDSSEAPNS